MGCNTSISKIFILIELFKYTTTTRLGFSHYFIEKSQEVYLLLSIFSRVISRTTLAYTSHQMAMRKLIDINIGLAG